LIIFYCAILAIVCYLSAAFLLLRRPARLSLRPIFVGLSFTGMLLHGIALAKQMLTPSGIDLGFFSTLALISLMVVFLYLLALLDKPVDKLGLAVLPLAALALGLRLVFPAEVHILTNLGPAMQAHILVSLLAFSLLNIAALQALLLTCQDFQLHRKRSGWFLRSLPPLETMEALLFQMIGVGFFLLSLSLVSGFWFIEDLFAQHLAHKTVLSLLSWLVFGVLLWGRLSFGWRGRTAVRWTLAGFGMLLLAYFGSKLVLEIILRRT